MADDSGFAPRLPTILTSAINPKAGTDHVPSRRCSRLRGGGHPAILLVSGRLAHSNRARGVGFAIISRTMSGLLALASVEDQMKAKGFAERSSMVSCGGLPGAQMPLLTSAVPLSIAEQAMLAAWQDPPGDPVPGYKFQRPSRGRFLITVANRPGTFEHIERTAEPLLTDPGTIEILP